MRYFSEGFDDVGSVLFILLIIIAPFYYAGKLAYKLMTWIFRGVGRWLDRTFGGPEIIDVPEDGKVDFALKRIHYRNISKDSYLKIDGLPKWYYFEGKAKCHKHGRTKDIAIHDENGALIGFLPKGNEELYNLIENTGGVTPCTGHVEPFGNSRVVINVNNCMPR